VETDLIVVGGGTGGLAAARTAARRGKRVLLVADGPLGGDCTWTGCVPSKTLIESAAAGLGFDRAVARVREIVAHIAGIEDEDVLADEGVRVLRGRARLTSTRGEVSVDGDRLRAPLLVLASGSGPAAPPVEGLDQVPYLTNETVFDLDALPGRLAVLGGGAIGCELAQAFARLGAQVTVVEVADRLLALEEPETSEVVTAALRADGVTVHTGTKVVRAASAGDGVVLTLDDGRTVEADRLLVAAGRRAGTEGLGLDEAGVRTERGYVVTDERMRTSVDGVYAVGDVTGRLQLTHAADEMGRVAVTDAFSRLPGAKFRAAWTPWAVFTSPEVGRVGMTEVQAAEHGGRVAYLPMSEVDRALAAGRTEGFVKLIAGPRKVLRNAGGGRLLGATVVCERGGELVHEAALAMRTGMFTGRLAQTTHAYPSWSMAVQKAAAQFFFTYEGRSARPARGG
jgi:pyruvate/2-oxoglutarate dehydrogenase complex dihydrolipoamide dehydrogenase (E3) component